MMEREREICNGCSNAERPFGNESNVVATKKQSLHYWRLREFK
jgi:hypothetical protein